MKKFFGIIAFTALLVVSFAACSDSDGPEKEDHKVRIYNENDSIALCEVLKVAYGPYLDGLLYSLNASLDNMASLSPVSVWETVGNTYEKRITCIALTNLFETTGHMPSVAWPSESYGHISPAIWDCEYMNTLIIESEMFHGELPPCGDGGKNLVHFEPRYTNLSSLPLDLFLLPKLTCIFAKGNMALKNFPDGLENVLVKNGSDYDYNIQYSGLEGVAPINLKCNFDLTYNEYTDVDWEELRSLDVRWILTNPIRSGMMNLRTPYLSYNKITGTIPDDILVDPLMMIYIENIFNPQQEGYGFDNMPPVSEIFAMKQKYIEQHPEDALALSKIYPLSEAGWLYGDMTASR